MATEMGMETGMGRDRRRSERATEWVQVGLILVLAAAIVAWSLLNRLA
jgi:hypothetical protein